MTFRKTGKAPITRVIRRGQRPTHCLTCGEQLGRNGVCKNCTKSHSIPDKAD